MAEFALGIGVLVIVPSVCHKGTLYSAFAQLAKSIVVHGSGDAFAIGLVSQLTKGVVARFLVALGALLWLRA